MRPSIPGIETGIPHMDATSSSRESKLSTGGGQL